MRTASRLLIGSVLAVLFSCFAIAADPSPPPNYQGLWWNSPPESESGWGVNLAHQGDVIFATWFTYDAAGDGWWLAMTASRTAEGTYSGTLIETAGPAFSATPFDPAKVIRYGVGSGTLSFRDPDNGTFSYTVNGVQQTKPITRQVFGPLPACTYGAQPDFVNATNYQDLWWAAGGTESGWGVNLTHQGDVLFATWFTYDGDGTPMWLAVTAPRIAQTRVYSGPLIRTTGPAFNATPFDPARVTRTVVGTATFTFANGNAATFAYTLDGVTRTKAITRYLFAPPAGTRCGEQEAAILKGKVSTATWRERARLRGRQRQWPMRSGRGANPLGRVGRLRADAPRGLQRLPRCRGDRGPIARGRPVGDGRGSLVPHGIPGAGVRRQHHALHDAGAAFPREQPPAGRGDSSGTSSGSRRGFRINPDAAPADGSLAQAVAKSVVAALKDTAATLDFSSPDALATVVAALPPALTELPQLRITTRNGAPIVSKEDLRRRHVHADEPGGIAVGGRT